MKRITAALFATALLAVAVPVASAAPKAQAPSPSSTSTMTIQNDGDGTTTITSNKDISSYYFVSCGGVKSEPIELEDGTYSRTLAAFSGTVVVKSGTTSKSGAGSVRCPA